MTDLSSQLAARGVTRRDFVALCGAMAATLGPAVTSAPAVAAALERASRLKPAVWINLGSCTGCTESLAQSANPDVASVVLDLLSLDYAETLSAAAGSQAEETLSRTIDAGGYIVLVEGSVMTAQGGNTLRIGGRPATALLEEVCARADAVIAVGSCAFDGGWVKADPNPGGATGVAHALPGVRERLVNLPTCPVNPRVVLSVVVSHLLLGRMPVLDAERRPAGEFGTTVHDGCPRRGHFSNGEFVEKFGSVEERSGWCLYKLGCKGPTTLAACPSTRWNREVSWCVEAGSPCIGCAAPDWVDANAPFLRPTDAVRPGIGGMKPENIGTLAAAGAAAAFAAWGVVETARGRLEEGSDSDTTDKSATGTEGDA